MTTTLRQFAAECRTILTSEPGPSGRRKICTRLETLLKDIRRERMEDCDARGLAFLDGVLEGVFTVPGDGDIDFKPILATLDEAGFEGWLIVEAEQDAAKAHPLTYAMKAREHLRVIAGI